jgi:hypothetical protein
LSRIENGVEIPNVLVLKNICQRLNVSLDQILYIQPTEIQRMNHLFHQVHIYFLQQNYEKLYRLLKDPRLTASLYLDTDFQIYYFYLGICELNRQQSFDDALSSFKKGLFFTYNKENDNISASEVQLLSMIGRTYNQVGNYEKAQQYLEESYAGIEQLAMEVRSLELVIVFYHYSSFLFLNSQLEQALAVANEGVQWVRERRSDFYLEELYRLLHLIYQQDSIEQVNQKYEQLANSAQEIRENGVDLS